MKHPTKPLISILIPALFLLLVFGFSAFMLIRSMIPSVPQEGEETESKTVTVDGVDYFPKQDLTTLLLMGIDQFGEIDRDKPQASPGAADLLALVLFDEGKREYNVVMLNRDTMAEMPVLGVNSLPTGEWKKQQLALSHTYGLGLEDSSENVRATVSKLLGGIEIDYYMSINMDAVGLLTDAVGGVPVDVEDDFSAVDTSLPQGKVTLNGNQALSFVRSRKDVGDQLNLSRMARQQEFIRSFLDRFVEKLDGSDTFVPDTYSAIAPYTVSDLSANTLSTLLSHYKDYTFGTLISPEGQNQRPGQYMEFHVDEQKLQKLVVNYFYTEKQ